MLLIARGRITSPYYCIGIFPLMYLCGKYYWNTYWDIEFLRNCDEQHISKVCMLLGSSMLGAALLARLFQYVVMPRLLKLDAKLRRDHSSNYEFVWSPPSWRFICFVVSFIVMILFWARIIRGVDFINDTLAMRKLMQGQGAAYLMLVTNLLVAMTAVFATCQSETRRYGWLRWLLPLGVCLLYSVFSGFASSIFAIALVIVNCVAIRRRLRLWWLPVLLFPAIVFFAFMHNLVRQAKASDPSTSVAVILRDAPNWRDVLPYMFNRLDYLEMLTFGYYELNQHPAEGLRPMLEVLVQPVPRAYWPGKPMNFSTSMSWRVMPDVVEEVGSTANFNAFNEFVRAFGTIIGPVIFTVALSLLLVLADYFHIRAQFNSRMALFYICIVIPYLSVGFIAGFINDLALPNLLISAVLLWMLETARIIPTTTILVSDTKGRRIVPWIWRVFFPKAST